MKIILSIISFFILFSSNFCYSQSSRSIDNNNNTLQNSTSHKSISGTSIPLNPERLQIIIKNGTSGGSDISTQTLTLYGNTITAAGAVGGGMIGSLLTFRHTRKIEEQKNKEARELEEQKRLAQKVEEEEFNARIRGLVKNELKFFSYNLDRLLTEEEHNIKENEAIINAMLGYSLQYPKLSLERRANIFDTESFSYIELSYQYFVVFSQGFAKEFFRYSRGTITLDELRSNLDIKYLKEIIDKSVEIINAHDTAADGRTKKVD